MRALVLAAGRGQRMGELTESVPKPLLEIDGQSLLERQIVQLRAAGIVDIVINLSYRGELIRAKLGDGGRLGVAIAYSDEGEPALETGGGVVRALGLLGAQPFVLVNADVVTAFDFGQFLGSTERSTLVLVPNPAHHPDGDYGIDAAGRATLAPPLFTYAGIALLEPELFAGLKPERRPLKPILDAAIARNRLWACRYDGLWFDAGTPARLQRAAAAIAATRGG